MFSLSSSHLAGVAYGVLAALGWAAGFVAAKHGIEAGFGAADIAVHRFAWTGLVLLPFAFRYGLATGSAKPTGIADASARPTAGIGWRRCLVITLLAGPTQSMLTYTGFVLTPLGHGTVIQPACVTVFGILLAWQFLGEPLTPRRATGTLIIVGGLILFGIESITTIGPHGIGGDLLFMAAGISWAILGTLLRQWRVTGLQAAVVVTALGAVLIIPAHALLQGYDTMLHLGLWENLLQLVAQGVVAGLLSLYLFTRSVILLGAGRANTFTALVPGFGLLLGYLALGIIPSLPQIAGMVVVTAGFYLTLRR